MLTHPNVLKQFPYIFFERDQELGKDFLHLTPKKQGSLKKNY
jgi:hypothetical protein